MTPSGIYSTKFQFSFESDNGNIFLINIKKQNYSGQIINRPLGASPILKRDTSDGGICGTSLELYAECQVDNEYAELYTSSARTFLVTLEKKRGSNWDVIWSGFIVPELYSAPDIAPPYDVQIIATDGIGELKNYPFAGSGRVSLLTTIKNIMSHTGQTLANNDIVICSTLEAPDQSSDFTLFLSTTYVDLDNLSDSNCYEALQAILQSINARMTMNDNIWYIIRENDMELVSGYVRMYDGNGGQGDVPAPTFGSMASYSYWPVGQLTTQVIPAKNRVSAAQEYHARKSLFDNPDLEDRTSWSTSGDVTWMNVYPSGQRPELYGRANTDAAITQAVSMVQYQDELTLSVGLKAGTSTINAKAHISLRLLSGGTNYYVKQNGDEIEWSTTASTIDVELPASGSRYLSQFQTTQLVLPPMPGSGTMTVNIVSKYSEATTVPGGNIFYVGWVYLTQNSIAGLRDNVTIDNGAREAGDELPLAFGGAPNGYANALAALYGIMSKSNGTLYTRWKTSRLSAASSFLELMAVDWALTSAQTRLRQTGTLNVPAFGNSILSLPMVLKDAGGLIYLLENMSWKLLDDEVEVSLVSRPDAASITVTDSTITEIVEPQTGGSGSGSGGSGGSGGTTDYNALNNKPSINGVTLQGNHDGASLQLIGYDVISYDDGDGTITLKYPTRVNIADSEETPVYRWVSDLLAKMYVTSSYVSVDASLIPTSNNTKDLGAQGVAFNDGFINNLWPEKVEFHDGSKIYEINSQLRLYGHYGVIIADDTNLSSLVYSNGEFVSTELDNLGSEGEPWNEVWANAFYVDYDIVDGNHWPKGFRWNNTDKYFELIGRTYFYGGDFLPMPSYQGSAVPTSLGNMYFWWDYAFVKNLILERDSNNINRGFGWVAANSWILCNTDINFSGNVYINGQPISASDESMKDNVEDLTDVAKILAELRAVSFDWKDSGQRGHGFIAQEVEKVLPDIVHKRGDGLLGLDYISLIAYLVKGWQEQQDRIAKLEIMVKQLMDKIK